MARGEGTRSGCALVLVLLTIALALPVVPAAEPRADSLVSDPRGIADSAPHAPINIDGDAGFNATNGVVGGNGSLTSPFVIANWSILSSLGPAISIVNTRAAFEVSDCVLGTTDLVATMMLQNVSDAALYRMAIENGTDRIVVSLAQRVRVNASTLTGMDGNGIRLQDSSDVLLENLTVDGSAGSAVELVYGSNVTLRGSILRNISGVSLTTLQVRNVHIDANRVENARSGFWIEASVEARATFNVLENVTGDAIALIGSANASAIGNRVDRADVGIWSTTYESGKSRSNLVDNNTVENARRGLWLSQALDSRMRNNIVRNASAHGIVVESSPGARLSGNIVENSRWGWSLRSLSGTRGEYPDEIRDDNLVDGRRVRYFVDLIDPVIPADPGYVGLVNVSGKVAAPEIRGQGEGLMIAASADLRIEGGRFSGNERGVSVAGSRNITLNGTWVNDSARIGIELRDVETSRVEGTLVANSTFAGLSLVSVLDSTVDHSNISGSGHAGVSLGEQSMGLEVFGNRLAGNAIGVEARPGSRSNLVSGNGFFGNVLQAVDNGQSTSWDRDGRGNYWSGFTSPDGDCDGIRDSPYEISAGTIQARDGFPLVKPIDVAIPPCAPGRPGVTTSWMKVSLDWLAPSWNGDAPVEAYRVLRGDTPSSMVELATVGSSHHEDLDVESNRTYYYAVSAGNRVGFGTPSALAEVEVRWSPAPRADPAAAWIRAEPAAPMSSEAVRIRLRAENSGDLVAQPFNATIEVEQHGNWATLAIAASPPNALAPGQGFDIVVERSFDNGSYRIRGVVSDGGAGNVAANDVVEMTLEVGAADPPANGGAGARKSTTQPLSLLVALLVLLGNVGVLAVYGRRFFTGRR